jgi:phosphatidylglycerol:prolipoprotein diacylglycerol transferase
LILIFFLLKNKKNMITPYLISYGIIRFLIEFYRNDPRGEMILNIISPSQFLSLIFILIGFIVYYLNYNKRIILNDIEIST